MTAAIHTPATAEPAATATWKADALGGVLIGTAMGDSLGLPMEGLSCARQPRLFPPPLRQRLIGGFGMMSDDTEHTFLLAQALLECPSDAMAFQRCFARKLRWWLLSLPAGVGFATLRAILKLWMGVPPTRSGVVSAGNGPAMRSALLGVYFADDPERRAQFVRASTEITHRDPRALVGAAAVAEAAAWMARRSEDLEALWVAFQRLDDASEWEALIVKMRAAFRRDQPVQSFAREIGAGNGVSGYVLQTVPVAIYAALRHRHDFAAALTAAIGCGGDTDTVGAITGALVGARVGVEAVPAAWRHRFFDWPRSLALLHRVAVRLSRQSDAPQAHGPVRSCWPALPLRNLGFLVIVLMHGFRRLLPPY